MSQVDKGDWEVRQEKLEEKKDLLVRLNEMLPWEEFRQLLEPVHDQPRKSNAGRKPIDVIVMLKLLVLQKLYNISDEELEYQVNDRLSFMRFLGLELSDQVPDATTVWLFRQRLIEKGLVELLFEEFDRYLRQNGYQSKGGQIVDATLIPVPKQRNRPEENEQIKLGEVPSDWQEKPHKLSQKDTEARWTQKNGQNHFGYKDHISIDVAHGFIRCYCVTDASVHDSQVLGQLLDPDNPDDDLWGDSAYRSQDIEGTLELLNYDSHIHERAYRNRPLSDSQKEANRERSKTRAKVEHVFGNWVMAMGGKLLRSIGLKRAQANLGLKNLVYNFRRYLFLEAQSVQSRG